VLKLVNVIGYDIGGANTKAAFISTRNGIVKEAEIAVEYFPIWKNPQKLTDVLLKLKQGFGKRKLDAVGVTMTAELSDVFASKREGVNHILTCVQGAFSDLPIYVLNVDGQVEPLAFAKENPLKVAAANWAATGWLVSHHVKDCVVVDVGSTSTSIIPIVDGRVCAVGKNDLEKLLCGELVYTGSLRTNVAAIVNSVPVHGGVATVASELFALSGDVHLVLGNITKRQYSTETADGKGKTKPEAYARLARVVCADTEMLTKQEITEIAKYIYERQIMQIAQGLTKVYSYVKSLTDAKVGVVVTGLGKNFLAHKAAEKIGAEHIIDLGEMLPNCAEVATPAAALALMMASKLDGGL
jgi:probable H4MPT-linked C1 transfer pathway protein